MQDTIVYKINVNSNQFNRGFAVGKLTILVKNKNESYICLFYRRLTVVGRDDSSELCSNRTPKELHATLKNQLNVFFY